MKLYTLATIITTALFTTTANAETSFSQVFRLTEPVGSMFNININSNRSSYFSGNFQSTFNFIQNVDNPQGKSTFTRNFNFNGNSNYIIEHNINNNVTKWNFNQW